MEQKNADSLLGLAPIYSKFIITNEETRKEWENLDAATKKFIESTLNATCEEIGIKHSIELLCNLYIDLQERIETLEKNKSLNKTIKNIKSN